MKPANPTARAMLLDLLEPALRRAEISAREIEDSFNLIESGLLDSIAFLDLIARLEERAQVEFDLFNIDPDHLTTFGGLLDLLTTASGNITSPTDD